MVCEIAKNRYFFLSSDLWHKNHFINRGISIGAGVELFELCKLFDDPETDFSLALISALLGLLSVLFGALLWTSSKILFGRKLAYKLLGNWKRLHGRGSASQLVTKLQSGTQQTQGAGCSHPQPQPPTQVFVASFPTLCLPLRGWCCPDCGGMCLSLACHKHGNFFAP